MKALFDHTFLCRVLQCVKEISIHKHRTTAEPAGQLIEIKPTADDNEIRSFLNERYDAWPDKGWKPLQQGQSQVPTFTIGTLSRYFVERRVARDQKAAADFSAVSDKAYRLFVKGFVQQIEFCHPEDDKHCSIRCIV